MSSVNWGKAVPAALTIGGALLGKAGADASANAVVDAATRNAALDEVTAQAHETNAGQYIAAAQRAAEDKRRTGMLLASRAVALAAASGGGASSPSVINNIARINGEAAYRAALDIYQGKAQAKAELDAAGATRFAGQIGIANAQSQAAGLRTLGTVALVKGGGTLLSKYGSDLFTSGGSTSASAAATNLSDSYNWFD